MTRFVVVVVLAVACGGESVRATQSELACEPRVVLANPGPSSGCFRAVAGKRSSVRLAGDDGSGVPAVDVHAGDAYEVVTCSAEWGAPTLEPCGGAD